MSGFVDKNGRTVPFPTNTEGQWMRIDGGGKGRRGERRYSGGDIKQINKDKYKKKQKRDIEFFLLFSDTLRENNRDQ